MTVTVRSDTALPVYDMPLALLQANATLRQRWVRRRHGSATAPHQQTLVVGELQMLLLHTMHAVSEQVRAGSAACSVLLAMLDVRDFRRALALELAGQQAPGHNRPQRTLLPRETIIVSPPLPPQRTLQMVWCRSWGDVLGVLQGGASSLLLPAVNFLWDLGPYDATHDILDALLRAHAIRRFPSRSAYDLLERKDLVFHRFHRYMLPVQMKDASTSTLLAASATLLRAQPDGRYFLKGAASWGKQCGTELCIKSGTCAGLVDLLRTWFTESHQRVVGVQPFVSHFDALELRHFCVPVAGRVSWKSVLTIKTRWHNEHSMEAEPVVALDPHTQACDALVQRILEDPAHAPMFEQLAAEGVRMIRVDCGVWNGGSAFFNEFAVPPDSSLWTDSHQFELVSQAGRDTASALWRLATTTTIRAPDPT